MSLYYDAAPLLVASGDSNSSLKSKVFNSKDLKSPPKQVYALVIEAAKWSPILVDVIEKSHLLKLERKLSPNLALLLVHDLLLNRRGVSAPTSHPLRLSVEKHKARLNAELTKARLKRGFASIDALRGSLGAHGAKVNNGNHTANASVESAVARKWPHPRWVRVNTLKTTLEEQLKSTFTGYDNLDLLEQLLDGSHSPTEKILHADKHIPNLMALPASTELSKAPAYLDGSIILQDKASCFPAYLLDPRAEDGNCLDACAAPGNKTTHLAAIIQASSSSMSEPRIYACEKDESRALTLERMVQIAGAEDRVIIRTGQDFLRVDPGKAPWNEVGSLLLDPSCSGSGIVGRDEALTIVLPRKDARETSVTNSKKRKKKPKIATPAVIEGSREEVPIDEVKPHEQLSARLTALSTFQLKLLLHALEFPQARSITYSTCSIYAQENEHVVITALASPLAKEKGWRILRREEQVSGMKAWAIRGNVEPCKDMDTTHTVDVDQIAQGCIRCEKGTKEGTQGFFVAAFVRDHAIRPEELEDNEWGGFSDAASNG